MTELVANKELTYIDLMLLDYKEVVVLTHGGYDWIEHGSDLYQIGESDKTFKRLRKKFNRDRLPARVRIIRVDTDENCYLGVLLVLNPRNRKDYQKVVFRAGQISKEFEKEDAKCASPS